MCICLCWPSAWNGIPQPPPGITSPLTPLTSGDDLRPSCSLGQALTLVPSTTNLSGVIVGLYTYLITLHYKDVNSRCLVIIFYAFFQSNASCTMYTPLVPCTHS